MEPSLVDGQQRHWDHMFSTHADMYGTDPSASAVAATDRFDLTGARRVLELGAGQGRDTMYFARRGFDVVAVDYAPTAVESIVAKAEAADLGIRVSVIRHDVREPLPFADESFDAHYSHMLLCMALTTAEIVQLAREIHRVLRPGAPVVYTVRHVGDAHYGSGIAHGDAVYEQGGFVVHFFDRALVDLIAEGFEIEDVTSFEEGELPRKLWRITMTKRAR